MKKQYRIIITHGVMQEYGHYSGIVAKVDALVRKYQKKFQTFDKCEHEQAETLPQPIQSDKIEENGKRNQITKRIEGNKTVTEQKSEDLTLEGILKCQNKLITKVSMQKVYEHFDILTKETNKNDEFYLTNEQLLVFINSTFINYVPLNRVLIVMVL
jgi:hypothetical protein